MTAKPMFVREDSGKQVWEFEGKFLQFPLSYNEAEVWSAIFGDDYEVCQICKTIKRVHLDDYGLTICRECWESHPEIRAKIGSQAREETDSMYGSD